MSKAQHEPRENVCSTLLVMGFGFQHRDEADRGKQVEVNCKVTGESVTHGSRDYYALLTEGGARWRKRWARQAGNPVQQRGQQSLCWCRHEAEQEGDRKYTSDRYCQA